MYDVRRQMSDTKGLPVNKLMIGSLSAVLLFSACGDDSGGSSSGTRATMLDMLITQVEAEGGKLDSDCAAKVIDKISDEDAAKIVAAGPDGDADVSTDAQSLGLELIECIEDFGTVPVDASLPDVSIPEGVEITDAMVDAMVTSLESSGMTVDRDCIGEALEGMDLAEVAAQGGSPTPEFIQQFIGCVTP
jgi:hypothetical protein